MPYWAMQNALGIVIELSRSQEEAFLGGQGLESLDPQAPKWPIKCFILASVIQSCSATPPS